MPSDSFIKDKKYVIYAHNGGGLEGGWDDALWEFLLRHSASQVVKVDFPFGKNPVYSSIRVAKWSEGDDKAKHTESFIKFHKPELLSYMKDFIYGIYYGFKYVRKAHLFVGMDCLLAFVGIILKRLGFVERVAYCIVDYTPVRYQNKPLNELYYFLDKFVCYRVDVVLPLHRKMIKGRVSDGRLIEERVSWVEAPSGNNSTDYKLDDYKRHDRKKIVYFGGVLKSKGAELFVPIAQSLIDRGFEDFTFICIGGGDIDYLKGQIKSSSLDAHFEVMGRIDDGREVESILFGFGVALAPYYPDDKNSFSYYADPGKVKIYLGCGLPVVITDVPPIAKDVLEAGAGEIADYCGADFAKKIMKIINDSHHQRYIANASKMGKSFSWDSIFDKVFCEVFNAE
jgi:glycosyltransferase involved in cell wall biosynthesis